MSTILITGANKGIGLEFCAQYKSRNDAVIAVCRNASAELSDLGVRIIDGIDISNAESIERLQSELAGEQLDVLINNAGILKADSFGSLDYEQMLEQFKVNTLGPLRVVEAFVNNLTAGSKVVILTSRVGSIEDNGSGGYYGYRASKTAVNQIGTNLMHELKPHGIAVAMLHPGYVATDMTGRQGITPAESVRGLMQCIEKLNIDTSGGFWHAQGYELPW